mgnify:CR=1 FL=1
MAGRSGRRGQRVNLSKIINSAIEEGIDAIIKKHPRFTDQEELLLHYLDKKKIKDYLEDYIKHSDGPIDIKHLINRFGGYVASGELFNERGKELILRESLGRESIRFFTGRMAREVLRGEKYLDETMRSFKDLYKLFKTGDYAQRMPKLAEAVSTVYDMGFADAAVNILYENGLMNRTKYRAFKRAINERVKQGVEYTQKSLAEYIIPQKVAAVIVGIIGMAVLLASNSITGAVIGAGKTSLSALLFGGLTLIAGIFLWIKKGQ